MSEQNEAEPFPAMVAQSTGSSKSHPFLNVLFGNEVAATEIRKSWVFFSLSWAKNSLNVKVCVNGATHVKSGRSDVWCTQPSAFSIVKTILRQILSAFSQCPTPLGFRGYTDGGGFLTEGLDFVQKLHSMCSATSPNVARLGVTTVALSTSEVVLNYLT